MQCFFLLLAVILSVLSGCNYRQEKSLGTDPLDQPGPAPTGAPSPNTTGAPNPTPKEWFTALQKSLIGPKCVDCHKPGKAGGDILLTSYQSVMESDPPIVIPGKPKSSTFYLSLVNPNTDKRMPKGGPQLSEQEIQLVYNWILKGAPENNPAAELEDQYEE